MFNNMGRKIRTVGKVFCWIGIVIAILAAIAGIIAGVAAVRYSGNVGYVVGIIIGSILGGCLLALLSWVGSFMLIGYGELIENTASRETRVPKSIQAPPICTSLALRRLNTHPNRIGLLSDLLQLSSE